jgi:aldehyde dehydrogenase (NAD+)
VHEAKTLLKKWYGYNAQVSPDVVRIVNKFHFNRLKKLLETTGGTIAIGGRMDEADLWIEPTVVVNVDPETDVLMQEEIFGPILPIVTVSSIHDALRIIQSKPKPLSLYIFSKDIKATRKVLESTSSGNTCINDVFLQGNRPGLHFGGVGESGMGSYHGKATFDTFSHRRAVLEIGQDFMAEFFYGFRYAPHTNFKILLFSTIARYFELFYVPFWGTLSHTLIALIALALAFLGFLLYPLLR